MSGRFVRASKFRHVFGKPTRKEACYDNLHISRNAWDTNLVKANPEYLSVNWEASGGGAFAVIPVNEKGRLPEQIPLFRGHTAPVLDTDWNPFNDRIIASGSDDGKVFVWQVPQGFSIYTDAEEPQDVAPLSKLSGHSRKVGHVAFNPAVANILASSSGDFTVKLWDIEAGKSHFTLKHNDIVQSMSWSAVGNMIVTTSRDKKLRLWDVRQEKPAHEVQGHTGAKNSRAVWLGEHNRIATTGFSKMSDRQLALWDVGNPTEPIGGFTYLDSISGVCMPFWDDGCQMLYLAGKGDGNIRYYEYENDKFEFLSEYKSGDPQRGIAFVPRRGLNVHEAEIMRAYKTVNDSYIEPVSFVVPRRSDGFQGDIYPPAVGLKPGCSASEWIGGADKLPPKIDMESIFEGTAPVEVPSDYKPPAPAAAAVPAPTKAASPVKKEPEPAMRSPPPTMSQQKGSIAAMASKYQDNEPESSDEDETSSFEEIAKPVQRAPIKSQSQPSPTKTTSAAAPAPAAAPAAKPVSAAPASVTPKATPTAASPAPSSSSSSVEASLQQITRMLELQTKTIAAQSIKIDQLTSEVDKLKKGNYTSNGEQSERIRQLELELEAARS